MTFDFGALSDKDILNALDAVVDEQGEDFIYIQENELKNCVYVKDGNPSCLIGSAFARLGVPIEILSSWDSDTMYKGGTSVDEVLEGLVSYPLMRALSRAQARQDNGYTWGDARDVAHETYVIYNKD